MQKVGNRKCIHKLSKRTLKKAKLRNTIAILAIALTGMLFTSVFTIFMSINKSFEEQNFRQAGSDFHGAFKDITKKQVEELKQDPAIVEYGVRQILGMAQDAPFLKEHVEVSYVDDTYAKHSYVELEEGSLPKEGTREAAIDTHILELLGVKPEIGTSVTLTYSLGTQTENPVEVTETFILSGWWEPDPVSNANHVLVSQSYAKNILKGYEKRSEKDSTGTWSLNVMLENAANIKADLKEILKDKGYQASHVEKDNYIDIGVNWGYTGAQLNNKMDAQTMVGIIVFVVLITCSGYLIIYNIFRISVAGDIRFYGLLKTIGVTGKQIRTMVRKQAVWLSCVGITAGLFLGWLVGRTLTPMVMNTLASYKNISVSIHPVIFIGAAAFSFMTVLLSSRKPAKMAGRVSPIEAIRYTEMSSKKKVKRGERGARIYRMALANMGRSKSKTVLVMLSLALAIVLLNVTYIFANGFDIDKYLNRQVCADFIVGHAEYFQSRFGNQEQGVKPEIIEAVDKQKGIEESGRIYGQTTIIKQLLENGTVEEWTDLYGMEKLPLSKLSAIEGDISKINEDNQIVAVMLTDDYGTPQKDSQHNKVGDEVEILYVDESIAVDSRTGEAATESTPDEYVELRYTKTHREKYTVCAVVTMINSMSYRFYGQEQFVLNAEEFKKQTGTDAVMSYLVDTKKGADKNMEQFLREYTEKKEPSFDYESKKSYTSEFSGLRNMFLFMGSALSFVIGIIGILNFVNSIVTSVLSRKREIAVLQAVGMTGKQLKQLLIMEGCAYGMGAILIAFTLNLILAPVLSNTLSTVLWFYTYHFTMAPILCMVPIFLIMGVLIPLIADKGLRGQSLVKRIREAE